MWTRRNFLAQSAFISLSPLAPGFLSRSWADQPAQRDERILVVLQLDGGNDGLNTVIPFADENYGRHRRELRIPAADVLKLNDEVGLHPAMKPAAKLLEDGRLTVIQGVGYPNPDRSHFRSMDIWHMGQPAAEKDTGHGWLGRALDSGKTAPSVSPDAVFVGGQAVPRALWGRRTHAISLNRESDLYLAQNVVPTASSENPPADDLTAYVERTVDQSFQAARNFAETSRAHAGDTQESYPDSDLARQLRLVSLMIKSDMAARVYYISQPGYDTHAGQAGPHQRLLRNLAAALQAFFDDLAAAQLQERVLLMAFSEFGRRVEENESAGTDHGAAGPMFLAGPAVAGGAIGRHPSLSDLDDGDLKMAIDFRAVYAALLNEWLRIPADTVLDGTFTGPAVLKSVSASPQARQSAS